MKFVTEKNTTKYMKKLKVSLSVDSGWVVLKNDYIHIEIFLNYKPKIKGIWRFF